MEIILSKKFEGIDLLSSRFHCMVEEFFTVLILEIWFAFFLSISGNFSELFVYYTKVSQRYTLLLVSLHLLCTLSMEKFIFPFWKMQLSYLLIVCCFLLSLKFLLCTPFIQIFGIFESSNFLYFLFNYSFYFIFYILIV